MHAFSHTGFDTDTRTARHDGWTPERKARFFDSLAAKGNVRLACRRAGLSPEAAYRLKRRDPLFARGWAAALVLAHDSGLADLADRAIDGVEDPVWYRGKQVGVRRRYDSRLFLAHLARLEKVVEDEAAQADASRFDELVACIAGEVVPPELVGDDPLLPLDRAQAAASMAAEAEEALLDSEREGGDGEGSEARDDEALAEGYAAAWREGHAMGAEIWDWWFDNACDHVDRLTGWNDPPPLPGLPGNPLPDALRRALEEAARPPCEKPLKSFSWTLSSTSTCALARGLAGPVRPIVPEPRSPRRGGRSARRGPRA